jgi:outer membrane protein OmpA-like peptidoglycan-associated protein
MTSVGGKPAREPLRGIPTGDSAHIAHTAFTPDGLFMIFNYCQNTSPLEIRCDLWIINKDVKGRWTKPRKLPEPLNMPGYTNTQPHIATEQGGKKLRLWFVSDRPGGKGKTDIWSAPLDPDWFCPCNLPLDARRPQKLPDFEAPKPAQAINTPESEYSPYFHSATNELYFSTDGLPGFGLQDVFRVKVGKNGWSEPENLGFGINSSYNDVYFSLSKDGKTGYISSNRPGAYYLDERNKACCNDIFSLQMYPPRPENPPATDSIGVAAKTPPPLPLPPPTLTTPPAVLADFKGLPLFFDNDEPDKRTRKTTTKKTYETTVLDYLERQEEYRARRTEGLKETAAEIAENEVNAFFDNEVRSGYERLNQLCELLLQRLQAGDTLEILIKGFTSPRAQSDYNLNLGKRRISSVRNHLAEWSDGALRQYINAGNLRITETSFGETTARAGLSDDLRDERNSVYAPDAARERRVEIVEIKTNHIR